MGVHDSAAQLASLKEARKLALIAVTTHGHSRIGSRAYRSWMKMRRRCNDPKDGRWKDYGGRGISVCKEWNEDFVIFLADMGYPPKGTTLDRYPNKDGNYEPGNCRWATPKQQQNNMRSNRLLFYKGQIHSVSEWAEIVGINKSTINKRITRSGWSISRALEVRP